MHSYLTSKLIECSHKLLSSYFESLITRGGGTSHGLFSTISRIAQALALTTALQLFALSSINLVKLAVESVSESMQ